MQIRKRKKEKILDLNDIKMSPKIKKGWLSTEKHITKRGKHLNNS